MGVLPLSPILSPLLSSLDVKYTKVLMSPALDALGVVHCKDRQVAHVWCTRSLCHLCALGHHQLSGWDRTLAAQEG